PEPLLQVGERWRQDKHHNGAGKHPFYSISPLDVNVEENVEAGSQLLLDVGLARAVELPVDIGPLDELVVRFESVEQAAVDEEIIDAIFLGGARCARGGGNRTMNERLGGQQAVDKRGLPRPRRPGHDDGKRDRSARHAGYSRFWTCSRSFSVSSL